MALKRENQELNEEQEKNQCKIHHDFMTGEKPRQTEKISSRKRAQKTKPNSSNRTQKQNVEIHKRVHAGETFVCDQCGKSFSDKKCLKMHVISHSAEKPFMCHQCGKTFKLNKYLTEHMSSHKREAFHLQTVWKELLTRSTSEHSLENSHWREAVHM